MEDSDTLEVVGALHVNHFVIYFCTCNSSERLDMRLRSYMYSWPSILYVMFAQAGRLRGIQVMTSTRNPTPSPNVQTNSHELFKTDACLLGTLSHALEVVGVLWVRDLV